MEGIEHFTQSTHKALNTYCGFHDSQGLTFATGDKLFYFAVLYILCIKDATAHVSIHETIKNIQEKNIFEICIPSCTQEMLLVIRLQCKLGSH